MIATNFRKHPDAQMVQMELELSGTCGADENQRNAFWVWLLNTGKVLHLPTLLRPEWWVAAQNRTKKLAMAVKNALQPLNFWKE